MRRAMLLACLAIAAAPAGSAHAGEWIAGDLHVHTTYSHDSYGGPGDDNTGPDDLHTLGYNVATQFAIARSRGLDYLAITDHNDVRSQGDAGFGTLGVIGVPAYENSLRGHAQMLGARRLYDDGNLSTPAVQVVASRLRADGGVFQVNHPTDPRWAYRYDIVPDTTEAWNLPWYYQPPLPAAADNDRALRYWEGWLDRGFKVGVTGGSDSHWVSTSALQGAGQPTTWVYVRERSVAGILAGLRGGHTFVSHQPPAYGAPKLFLQGSWNRGRFDALVGDIVRPLTPLRIRVARAPPGSRVRVVTDGGRQAFAPLVVPAGGRLEHRFTLPSSATWARAELYGEDLFDQRVTGCNAVFGADVTRPTTYCANRVLMLALTSAIYLGDARRR